MTREQENQHSVWVGFGRDGGNVLVGTFEGGDWGKKTLADGLEN